MCAPDPTLANVRAIADLERLALHQRSVPQRFTDGVTSLAGSATFIVIHLAWFFAWVAFNQRPRAFDPYPFNLLNGLVSIEAVFLTSFVLMTQNRMTRQADQRARGSAEDQRDFVTVFGTPAKGDDRAQGLGQR